MPHFVRRCSALSVVGTCAVLAGPMSSAQASDNAIRATLTSYNAKILHDEAAVLNGIATYQKNSQSAPLVKALSHEVSDLRKLKGKLSRETGSTARGRRGKADVAAGLGLIAKSYGTLARDFTGASASNPVPRAELLAALATDKKGRAKIKAGVKLLS